MMTSDCSHRTMTFALYGLTPVMELPRAEALALLEWLGLGRPEFGAVDVRVLLPLCQRRLWPVARNDGPLKDRVAALTAAIEWAPEAVLEFA